MTPERLTSTPAAWGEFKTFTIDTTLPLGSSTAELYRSPAEPDATPRLASRASTPRGDDPLALSPTRLLRPEEAADYLALSRARVYELMAAGEIESILIGRSRRIPLAALDDFVTRLRAERGCHSPRAS